MEKHSEGPGAAPRIVEVMYFQGLPKQTTQQQNMGLPQQWEAQWQEFLRTLQPALIGQGNPQLTDTVPWDDAKTFLSAFEQIAEACRWPREEWVGRLVPALRGGVEQYICQLEPRDRRDYQKVKAAILRSDVVRMELKRQHFRQCRYQELEGPRRAYDQLQQLVRQWLKPEKHTKDQILEMIIQEQLLATLPPDLQSWVQECGPEDCIEMVALAEDFLMGHRSITRAWDRQVPAKERNAGSTEALPRQQYGGVTSSEMTPTRSSSVSLSFEEPQTSEAGLTMDSMPLKKDANLDQKPTSWELMRASSRSSSCTSVLPAPSPETTSQLGPHREESTPRTFADGRFLSNIKTETTDDSEDDNCYEPLPNEFPAATSSNRLTGQINPGSKLPPREEHETSAEHRDEHVRKKNKYDPLGHMHVCSDCGFQAYYISELRRHMKKHSNVDYNCAKCGETIKGLIQLENHQKTHEGLDEPSTTTTTHTGKEKRTSENRPYRCPECDQTFIWQSSLSRHLRLHQYRRILPARSKDLHEPQRSDQESTGDFREIISLHPAVDNSDPASRLRPRKPQEPDVQPLRQGIKTLRVVLTKLANTRAGKTHRCPECGYKTKMLSVLVKHMAVHTKNKPYTCHGCGKTFAWVSGLTKHQKYVCSPKHLATGASTTQPLERQGSDEESRRMTTLPQEKSDPEGASKAVTEGTVGLPVKKTYPCSKCEYRAEKLSDLIKHIRIHIGEKPYKCHICEKAFTSPSSFAKHWQTHSDASSTQPAPIPGNSSSSKGPAVAECDVTLSDEEEMINVLAQKSKPGGNKSAGKSAGAVSLGDKKQQQKRKPTGTLKNTVEPKKSRYAMLEKKHKCSYCDYKAYYVSDLLRHQVKHTKEKPYKCPECGQGFLKKSTMRSHHCNSSSQNQPGVNRNHNKEKRKYTCSKCGHKTYKLSTLLVHLRSHTDDRPYKCEECGASFTQSSNLSRHRNIHLAARASVVPPTSTLEPQENSEVPTENEISSLMKVKEEEMEMEVTPPVTQEDSSMITSINKWRYNKEANDGAPAEECNKPIEPIKQEPAEELITPKEEKEMEGYGDPVQPPKEVTPKETVVPVTPKETVVAAVAEGCDKSAEAPRDNLARKGVSVRAMLERFAYCKVKEPEHSKAESETNPTDQEEAKKPPSEEVKEILPEENLPVVNENSPTSSNL